jgi:hypothetical protein
MTNRAVVDRRVFLVPVPGGRFTLRQNAGRTMTEAGQSVQCRPAQGDETVKGENRCQEELTCARTHLETLGPAERTRNATQ